MAFLDVGDGRAEEACVEADAQRHVGKDQARAAVRVLGNGVERLDRRQVTPRHKLGQRRRCACRPVSRVSARRVSVRDTGPSKQGN